MWGLAATVTGLPMPAHKTFVCTEWSYQSSLWVWMVELDTSKIDVPLRFGCGGACNLTLNLPLPHDQALEGAGVVISRDQWLGFAEQAERGGMPVVCRWEEGEGGEGAGGVGGGGGMQVGGRGGFECVGENQ